MSKSYDDHDGETIEQLRSVLRAVRARINGVFDDPDLLAMGPLGRGFDDINAFIATVEIDALRED